MSEMVSGNLPKEAAEKAAKQAKEKKPRGKFYKKKSFWILVILAVLVVAVAAVFILQSRAVPAAAEPVATITLEPADIASTALLSGTIHSASAADVYAPSSLTIKELRVEEGSVVKAGDILAALDTESLLLDIQTAELNLQNAKVSLETAEKDLANNKKSASNSLGASKIELDAAQRSYDEALASVLWLPGSSVQTALTELETAQRRYNDLLAQEMNTAAVQKARLDLESAQNSYNSSRSSTSVDSKYSAYSNSSDSYNSAVSAYNDYAAQKNNPSWSQDEANKLLSSITTAQSSMDKAYYEYISAQESASSTQDSAQITLDKAHIEYQNALKTANDNLLDAADSLKKAQINYDNALKTQESNFTSANDALLRAQNSYSSAAQTSSYNKSKSLQSNEIGIMLQEISLEKLYIQLEQAVIRAPVSGTVTYANARLGGMASGLMFVIEDMEDLEVVTTVGEWDAMLLAAGQRAQVKTDSTGDTAFDAQVKYIASSAVKAADGSTSDSTDVKFSLKVSLTDPDEQLKIGMNAKLTIILDKRENVYAVPIEAVTKSESGNMIVVYEEESTRMIPVELGLETDTHVEIQSDQLEEGMQILSGTTAAPAQRNGGIMGGMMMGGGRDQ